MEDDDEQDKAQNSDGGGRQYPYPLGPEPYPGGPGGFPQGGPGFPGGPGGFYPGGPVGPVPFPGEEGIVYLEDNNHQTISGLFS